VEYDEYAIYEEKFVSKATLLLSGTISALVFAMAIIVPLTQGITEENPLWSVILLGAIAALLVFLTASFTHIRIMITAKNRIVKYGVAKKVFARENIMDVYRDETGAMRYGGWGIRMAKVNGKRRYAYSTLGERRVVVTVKGWKYDEFVFSTKKPDDGVMVLKGM